MPGRFQRKWESLKKKWLNTWRILPVLSRQGVSRSSSHRPHVWYAAMNLRIVGASRAPGAARSAKNLIFKARDFVSVKLLATTPSCVAIEY